MPIFDQLGLQYDRHIHYEAYVLVQDVLAKLRSDLYASSRLKRVLIYISLLRQISIAMCDDGGPTVGRRLLEESLAEMVNEERSSRGVCASGPFLTDRQLRHLLQDPAPEGLGWPFEYTDDDKAAV